MISTRLPSEAELIELENWLDRMDNSDQPLLKPPVSDRGPMWTHATNEGQTIGRRWATIRALLDLARTVKNSEK